MFSESLISFGQTCLYLTWQSETEFTSFVIYPRGSLLQIKSISLLHVNTLQLSSHCTQNQNIEKDISNHHQKENNLKASKCIPLPNLTQTK